MIVESTDIWEITSEKEKILLYILDDLMIFLDEDSLKDKTCIFEVEQVTLENESNFFVVEEIIEMSFEHECPRDDDLKCYIIENCQKICTLTLFGFAVCDIDYDIKIRGFSGWNEWCMWISFYV